MRDFRSLDVWNRSMVLAESTYAATECLPAAERFELRRQMRRAAVSVPSNIAEGCGRSSARDFARFLRIAYGSNCELETQVRLADALGLMDARRAGLLVRECEEIRRMLFALIARIEVDT